MHRLATSPAADPSLNVAQEGSVRHGVRATARRRSRSTTRSSGRSAQAGPIRRSASRWATRCSPRSCPGVAPHVSIGGYNLGVSAYSKHPDQAFDALQCLTQPQNQSRDAIKGGLAPVAASIYDQPSFDKAYPFHALIKPQLQTYGIRPQTPAYADVTLAIQKALSPTSSINPSTVVSTLRNEIKLSLSSAALL